MFRRRGICFWIGIACVVTGVFIILALVLPAGFWWFALGGALIAAGVWLLRCCRRHKRHSPGIRMYKKR